MADKTDNIIQMIVSYTDQIERYENSSTWCAAFSVTFILLVAMMAIALITKRNKEGDNKTIYNGMLSALFLTIPSIITLYLYVFAMNTRKVALYRGYLSFLEERWNSLAEADIMLFDSGVIKNFYSFPAFPVNGLGPVVLALFILLFVVLSFGLSRYFGKQLKSGKTKSTLKSLWCILMIICVLFNGLCIYCLSTNDFATESVINYCEEQEKN